jgi:hypothetical protein
MTTEAVSPLPGPTFKQQRARDKHSQVLTETPQKKILEDWNKNKIGEEKIISSKETNACKKKMKQLHDERERVPEKCFACDDLGKEELWYRRTGCGIWVHEECSGWDSPDGYLCYIYFKMA